MHAEMSRSLACFAGVSVAGESDRVSIRGEGFVCVCACACVPAPAILQSDPVKTLRT